MGVEVADRARRLALSTMGVEVASRPRRAVLDGEHSVPILEGRASREVVGRISAAVEEGDDEVFDVETIEIGRAESPAEVLFKLVPTEVMIAEQKADGHFAELKVDGQSPASSVRPTVSSQSSTMNSWRSDGPGA